MRNPQTRLRKGEKGRRRRTSGVCVIHATLELSTPFLPRIWSTGREGEREREKGLRGGNHLLCRAPPIPHPNSTSSVCTFRSTLAHSHARTHTHTPPSPCTAVVAREVVVGIRHLFLAGPSEFRLCVRFPMVLHTRLCRRLTTHRKDVLKGEGGGGRRPRRKQRTKRWRRKKDPPRTRTPTPPLGPRIHMRSHQHRIYIYNKTRTASSSFPISVACCLDVHTCTTPMSLSSASGATSHLCHLMLRNFLFFSLRRCPHRLSALIGHVRARGEKRALSHRARLNTPPPPPRTHRSGWTCCL